MNEQIDLFGNLIKNFPKSNKTDKQKRNWENAFQRWSDTETHGRKTTPNYVDDIANQILHDVVPQEIDNLVKEMTEGKNG
jgi:hypothetical protein